jgi:hypothetical protein
MAATYDATLATDKDWVRALVGDRDMARPFFQDEEIAALLKEEANKYLAAARGCELILAKGHGVVEKSVDDLRLRWSDNARSAYATYIRTLRVKGADLTLKTNRVFRVL